MNERTQAEQLSQRVERDVRQALGELTMQTIVLRAMLDMQQQPSQPQHPMPPEQPEKAARMNGGAM
jgi:hypothetical protein